MKNKILKVLAFMFIAIVLFGCDDPNNNIEDAEPTLYLITDNYLLYVGDEKEIEYYVEDLDEYELLFEVANPEIAIVEDNMLKALDIGETVMDVLIVGHEETKQQVSIKVLDQGSPVHDQVFSWVKSQIGTEQVEARLFPKAHPSFPNVKITYKSSKPELISDNGLLFPADYDEEASITITVDSDGVIAKAVHEVVVVGNVPGEIARTFLGQFPNILIDSVNINYFKDRYPDVNITYTSLNEDVLTNTGIFTKPEIDTSLIIQALIEIPSENYQRVFTKTITARGLSLIDKSLIIKENIIEQLGLANYRITDDLELPFAEERFNASITWDSTKPELLNKQGRVTLPLVNTLVELIGNVKIGNDSTTFRIELELMGKENDNTWDNIEEFLNTYIFLDEIETMKYSVMGVKPAYTAYNNGYLMFYKNEDLEVIDDILPSNHPFRPKTYMKPEFVTIHDTANNGEGADAEMHSRFIHNRDRTASSWHYTIDDHSLYQHVPLNEVAWHAGEAVGNRTSIGIETCTHIGVDYDLVIRRTAKLVAKLLDEFDLTLYNVRQHNYWSGKNCPQVIRGSNRWGEVIDLIGLELYARQNFKDVTFEWKSLSPDILDDTGKVFSHPGNQTEVSYQVTVTYNGQTKVFSHTSTLQASK